tara:strand:- start:8405 stop:9688 length:1284 start_codon:yes stop_codon:yes gene_type:complete
MGNILVAIILMMIFFVHLMISKGNKVSTILLFIMTIFTVIPSVVGHSFYFSYVASLILIFSIFSFSLGSMIADTLFVKQTMKNLNLSLPYIIHNKLNFLIYFGILAIFISTLLSVNQSGYSLSEIRSFEDIASIALINASNRYNNIVEPSILQSTLLAFTYLSALICGGQVASVKKFNKSTTWIYYRAFLIIIFISLFGIFQNTKASSIYGFIFFFSGYISISSLLNQIDLKKYVSFFFRKRSLLIFTFFVSLMLWMQSSRYGGETSTAFILTFFTEYAFGHVSGFYFWFDNFYNSSIEKLTLGTDSFAGITNIFFDDIQGSSPENIPKVIHQNYITNVDMLISELIKDFGAYFTIIIFFISGFFVSMCDCLSKNNPIAVFPIAFISSGVSWGWVSSFYEYSIVWLCYLLFLFICISSLFFKRIQNS